MPERHGLLVRDGEALVALGIWNVFDPWIEPRLVVAQGFNLPPHTRPMVVEFHFRRVCIRLVSSLLRLQRELRRWQAFLDDGALAGPNPILAFEIPEQAGMAADAVVHYLALLIDDVGRMVPFALDREIDFHRGIKPRVGLNSFEAVRKAYSKRQHSAASASPRLVELFEDLERPGSWWQIGFRAGSGARQRLVHCTDILLLQASTKPGDAKMTADVMLTAVGGPVVAADFEDSIRQLLAGLCEWLDALEKEVLPPLTEKLSRRDIAWRPLEVRPRALLVPDADVARQGLDLYLPRITVNE